MALNIIVDGSTADRLATLSDSSESEEVKSEGHDGGTSELGADEGDATVEVGEWYGEEIVDRSGPSS